MGQQGSDNAGDGLQGTAEKAQGFRKSMRCWTCPSA